jgi:hypothetical protein
VGGKKTTNREKEEGGGFLCGKITRDITEEDGEDKVRRGI